MPARENSFLFLAVALCVGFPPGARGEVEKKPVPPAAKAQGPAPLRDLFLDLDANGDRVIEKNEVPESGLKAFETLLKYGDTNHDGKLDAPEYRALLERVNWSKIRSPAQLEHRFKMLDKNEDGKLDRKEFPGAPARFDVLDKNEDGFLSRDEIPWLNGERPAGRPVAKKPRN
jgi:EF hand